MFYNLLLIISVINKGKTPELQHLKRELFRIKNVLEYFLKGNLNLKIIYENKMQREISVIFQQIC